MTNKVTMPEPVVYAIFAENGNIRLWSNEPRDLPDMDSLGPMRQLITTDQAEAYANQRVKQALEEAEQICRDKEKDLLSRSRRMQHHHGAGLGASMCGDAISALIPKG